MDTTKLVGLIKTIMATAPEYLQYFNYLSYILLATRIIIVILASYDYISRDTRMKNATTLVQADIEIHRWKMRYGESGYFDLIGGLIFAVTISLAIKLISVIRVS
jgi:hypothetical protein